MPDPQVGKSVVGPRTFLTVQEFFWYNSAICRSSAWQLYGGVNGDLLQEGLCHAQNCCIQSPCACGRPLLTLTSSGDTQTLQGRSDLVSVGSSGVHKVLFEPSECLWWVWGLIINAIFAPPIVLLGLLLCPWTQGIFFWWDPTFSCQWLFSSEL